MEITIYGPPFSNYVRSVRLLCAEKGIPYRLSLGGAADIQRFRAEVNPGLHPFVKVPILDHGDFRLFETSAILRYLDEVFPGPQFVPADVEERARMEQWISATHPYFDRPIIRELVLPAYRAALRGEDFDFAARGESLAAVRHGIEVLDRHLQGRAYLAGEAISLADLLLLPILDYAERIPDAVTWLASAPELRRWLAELRGRPSFAAACATPATADGPG